jgi:hypothetical protein
MSQKCLTKKRIRRKSIEKSAALQVRVKAGSRTASGKKTRSGRGSRAKIGTSGSTIMSGEDGRVLRITRMNGNIQRVVLVKRTTTMRRSRPGHSRNSVKGRESRTTQSTRSRPRAEILLRGALGRLGWTLGCFVAIQLAVVANPPGVENALLLISQRGLLGSLEATKRAVADIQVQEIAFGSGNRRG